MLHAGLPREVSKDDAPKEGTTLMAPPSLVQQVDRIFTQRNPRKRNGLHDNAPNREDDALGHRRHHHQQVAGKTIAQRIPFLPARPQLRQPRKTSWGQRRHRATTAARVATTQRSCRPAPLHGHAQPRCSSPACVHGRPPPLPE